MTSNPRVTIGLPVRNGENYLEETLASLRAQSFPDFEIVVSDNASTDATAEICERFAKADPRIRYHRQSVNVGAAANYTSVFSLARGEYFKFAAHDDKCRPDFLRACVERLDEDPGVVLAFPRAEEIDRHGAFVATWPSRPLFESDRPDVRLKEALAPSETFPIWGVIRSDALRRTRLLGNYPGHDVPFLAELALRGRFAEVPDYLFLHREHPDRSIRVHNWRRPHDAVVWYDPRRAGKIIFPTWRVACEIASAISRSPLSLRERARCAAATRSWLRANRTGFAGDLVHALGQMPVVGRSLREARTFVAERSYRRVLARCVSEITAVIPEREPFILIDEDIFSRDEFGSRKPVPLVTRDGKDWGYPGNDYEALDGLERHESAGVRFLVFAWPAFWWLDHYSAFSATLVSDFRRTFTSKRIIVFDLTGREAVPEKQEPPSSRIGDRQRPR